MRNAIRRQVFHFLLLKEVQKIFVFDDGTPDDSSKYYSCRLWQGVILSDFLQLLLNGLNKDERFTLILTGVVDQSLAKARFCFHSFRMQPLRRESSGDWAHLHCMQTLKVHPGLQTIDGRV